MQQPPQPFGNQPSGGQSQQQPYYPQQPYPGQPGQPGMYPQQQPPKKKRNPLLIGCGAALALVVIIIVIVVVASAANTPKANSNTGTTGNTATATSAPATTGPVTWKTIQSFRGNGIKKTAVFAVPGDWKINYTCTGSSVSGTNFDGALAVTVYGSDGTLLDVAVNATCKGGQTTKDSTEEHQAGNVYLNIDATDNWTIQVQAPQ